MDETKKSVVLLTSFGPFGSFEDNPSEKLVSLAKTSINNAGEDFLVESHSFAVAYEDVEVENAELWRRHQPVLVVHVGVGSPLDEILVESRAFSSGYCRADVRDRVPPNNRCRRTSEVEETRCTQLDVCAVVEEVRRFFGKEYPIKVALSDDPGKYLCGFVYYDSLCEDAARCLFVHTPIIGTNATAERQAAVLERIVREALKQVK